MEHGFYRDVYLKAPVGYANLKIICDEEDKPCDYVIIEVNAAFERITGLEAADIIGKRATAVWPELTNSHSCLITGHGQTEENGEALEFKQYAKQLQNGYYINAFSPQKDYLVTLLYDIPQENNDRCHLCSVNDISKRRETEAAVKEQEKRFSCLFNSITNGAAIFEAQGDGSSGSDYIIKDFNTTALKWGGYKRGEVLGRSILELWPNIEPYDMVSALQRVWKCGRAELLPAKKYIGDHICGWYETRISRLESGEIVTIFENVTAKYDTGEQLRQSEENLRLVLDSAAEAIYGIDPEGICTFCNASCLHILGYSQEDLIGKKIHDMIHHTLEDGTHLRAENCFIRLTIDQGIQTHAEDEILWRADGTCFPAEYYAYPQYKDGQVVGAVVTFMDITERKQKEKDILYLNYHDSMTGLYNRTFFDMETKRLNHKKCLPISVIIGDINGLKMVNDALGHAQGDKLIIGIGEILKKCCSESDVVARTGGDEFGILLPKTDTEGAHAILKRIQAECKNLSLKAKNEIVYSGIALGYDTKTLAEENIYDIIKTAEDYMYKRKLIESKSAHINIISAIKSIMYEKSQETDAQAERLVALVIDLGVRMGLNEKQLEDLALFSTLHDIGKIGIDSSILNKDNHLSKDEQLLIRKHPEVGYRIARASQDLVNIADYILCHHERWDGTGYPQGLSGTKIPLYCRIFAVVDAYDAMTRDHPYKKAVSGEKAVEEIMRGAGTQFDPEVARIFAGMMLKSELVPAF